MKRLINSNHYIVPAPQDHPNKMSNGYIYEHILIAEEKLGRYLTDEETVHHLDNDGFNNSPDNLLIFASNAEHTAYHKGRPYYLDENGIAHVSIGKRCSSCGKVISNDAEFCRDCYKLQRHIVEWPNREELKLLVREKSFIKIGKMYGVSDNAIKKWCDSFNIPRRKKDILQYTDDEWAKV